MGVRKKFVWTALVIAGLGAFLAVRLAAFAIR